MSAIVGATHDPTRRLPIDLAGYVALRERSQIQHLVDGVPDYGFSLDRQLRQKLSAIPALRWALRTISHSLEPACQQIFSTEGVAVGPDQYPEIHAMGEQCARLVRICIPRIFISSDAKLNAMTLASDNAKPSIIITSSLVQILEERELLAVIGHECGHVHNLHGSYNTLAELLTNPLARDILATLDEVGGGTGFVGMGAQIVQTSITLFTARWSRCAEVTCDRAGAICAGDSAAMANALAKLQTGGDAVFGNFNLDAYMRQIQSVQATSLGLGELTKTHPLAQRRIAAVLLFANSDVFQSWCPNAPVNGATRALSAVDADGEPLISVWGDHPAGQRIR